jgi:hypothetical protein
MIIPKEATKLDHNIIAKGEATGHHHRLAGPDAGLFLHCEIMYLDIPKKGKIEHEEHAPINYDAPVQRIIGRVKEYDHFEEEARVVAD